MSATPPSGTPSHPTPNGQPQPFKRKPVIVDPLVGRKKPPVYRPPPAKRPPAQINGRPSPAPITGPRPLSAHPSPQPIGTVKPEPKRDVSGFSDPTVTNYQDFKLVTTKRQLLEGLRHHVLNIVGNQNLDLQNEDQFTRPVRLHRRDPRAQPPGQAKEEAEDAPPNDMDKIEREAYQKRKEERQKEREANKAQIAPSVQSLGKPKNFTKKTEQVFRPNQSAELKQKYKEKYEETYPWHLEDFNDKHCLVGQNQPTMSRLNAALALEPDPSGQAAGRCRIIPVEKWYKFAPKTSKPEIRSIEEIEKQMKKGVKDPAWLVNFKDEQIKQRMVERDARKGKGLYIAPIEDAKLTAGRDPEGVADLDFDDDFADDEEGNTFGDDKDEDTKLAEERIRKEQLQANIFNHREEKEVDLEEKREQYLKSLQGEFSKKLNKSLRKREGNYNLGSDSDEANPYKEESESEDSEEEAARKAAEEAASKLKEEKGNLSSAEAGGTKSGASSKGTNTPSGRKEKHHTGSDRDIIGKKIRRPGSPQLSDAGSGTDTSKRNKHLKPPAPGSRLADSKKRKSLAPSQRGGAGSDSETAGGAASDGGKPKRIKLNPSSVSPPGSPPRVSSPPPTAGLPPAPEVIAAIPPQGISAMELFKKFKTRISSDNRAGFWGLMKRVGHVDRASKMVFQKGSPAAHAAAAAAGGGGASPAGGSSPAASGSPAAG